MALANDAVLSRVAKAGGEEEWNYVDWPMGRCLLSHSREYVITVLWCVILEIIVDMSRLVRCASPITIVVSRVQFC